VVCSFSAMSESEATTEGPVVCSLGAMSVSEATIEGPAVCSVLLASVVVAQETTAIAKVGGGAVSLYSIHYIFIKCIRVLILLLPVGGS
jgi:hypothetical protein